MAGYRAIGVVVILAAAAFLARAARAADDDDAMHHWKCFKSCTRTCHDEDAVDGDNAGGVSRRCKTGCLGECFEELRVVCYQQCVVSTCLCLPPYSKEKMTCMKNCCDKCFHHGPKPPGPGPKPPTPGPGPKPPTPGPGPKPPTPKPPTPKPPMPPPSPKAPPKPKPPCPPTSEAVNADGN